MWGRSNNAVRGTSKRRYSFSVATGMHERKTTSKIEIAPEDRGKIKGRTKSSEKTLLQEEHLEPKPGSARKTRSNQKGNTITSVTSAFERLPEAGGEKIFESGKGKN